MTGKPTFAILGGGFGVPGDTYMDSLEHFKKIKNVKIVDVHGSEDRKPVLDVIKKRKVLSIKLHKNRYQLLKIEGANHFYRDKQDELTNSLSSWLDENIAP